MLKDGRLTGLKIGQQWRFPRQMLEECLISPQVKERITGSDEIAPSVQVLPADCLEPIQDVFATAANIGAVTTALDGKPLTPISNSCTFCDLILASPEGRKRCEASWALLASASNRTPRIEQCHAGLSYARGRIQVKNEFVGMIFAGQFLPNASAHQGLALERVARDCYIPEEQLRATAKEIRIVEAERTGWLLGLLQKVADTFSHIGQRQLELIERLRQVAQIAQV